MSNKIKVSICTGTACFVMGASELLLLEEQLPNHLKDLVEIDGSNCLGFCRDSKNGKAPFVTINNKVLPDATIPEILENIQELFDAEYK